MGGAQGARRGSPRRRRGAPHRARADLPRGAAGHGERGGDPRALGRRGPHPVRALRGLGLHRCGAAGRRPAGPRHLARRAGAGHPGPAGAGGGRVRPAALRHRPGLRAGHPPAGRDLGVPAPRAWRDGDPRVHARFGRADRGSCAARAPCAPATAARRYVLSHPREEHEAPKAARARTADPATWQGRCLIPRPPGHTARTSQRLR